MGERRRDVQTAAVSTTASKARALIHHAEGGFDELVGLEAISPELFKGLVGDQQRVLWLDIQDPTSVELELLREQFGFHELALEDVARRNQRAKIEHYQDYSFIVFFAVRLGVRHEISIFIGPNYLVTVHQGEVPELAETVERWRHNADRIEHSVALPVYSLFDAIVDGYFPVIDAIAERVEKVEDGLFSSGNQNYVPEVLLLKRELLNLRRVIAPEREVLNVLIRRDQPLLGVGTIEYFQDIYDHIIRVLDAVDLYRDQLTSLLEAHLSVVSNRLNFVMKRMTALATMLMSVNLIASNYGMNFHNMPELDWQYGYFFTIGLMLAVALALFVLFRRIEWL